MPRFLSSYTAINKRKPIQTPRGNNIPKVVFTAIITQFILYSLTQSPRCGRLQSPLMISYNIPKFHRPISGYHEINMCKLEFIVKESFALSPSSLYQSILHSTDLCVMTFGPNSRTAKNYSTESCARFPVHWTTRSTPRSFPFVFQM